MDYTAPAPQRVEHASVDDAEDIFIGATWDVMDYTTPSLQSIENVTIEDIKDFFVGEH